MAAAASTDELGLLVLQRGLLGEQLEGVLREMRHILVDRGASYSDIADNSEVFSDIMQVLGVKVPGDWSRVQHHCMANIAIKLARFASGDKQHEDTFLDIANYAVLILADMRRNKLLRQRQRETQS